MAFRAEYRYPLVAGPMLNKYEAELAAWAGLKCERKRPDTMPKRLLTLRVDGGPDNLGVAAWGFGVNVWADTPTDAENLALDAAAVSLRMVGVSSIKAVRDLVGPYEVEDEPLFTHNGNTLSHFYFSFDAVVKAD